MQQILEQAVEHYRRQQILEATNAAYAALQADQAAWAELEHERAGRISVCMTRFMNRTPDVTR
jgi:hypothetical protein